tara:strand:+ start:9924 stop:10403 length:480 start_codon:yes stop_codon:yes gene_type:complete
MVSEEDIHAQLIVIAELLGGSAGGKVENIPLPGIDIPPGETKSLYKSRKGTKGDLQGLHITISSREAVVNVTIDGELKFTGNPVVMDRDGLNSENRMTFWMPNRADIDDPEQNTTQMFTPQPHIKFYSTLVIDVFNPSATTACKIAYGRMRLMTEKKNG